MVPVNSMTLFNNIVGNSLDACSLFEELEASVWLTQTELNNISKPVSFHCKTPALHLRHKEEEDEDDIPVVPPFSPFMSEMDAEEAADYVYREMASLETVPHMDKEQLIMTLARVCCTVRK